MQSAVNKVIKDISALTEEKDSEELKLQQETAAYKRQKLAYKKADLELKTNKLDAKRAAFERSLERKKHSLERVKNGQAMNDYVKELLVEAKNKREKRLNING